MHMDTHFIQTPNPEPLAERLISTINKALTEGVPVAWFLSGGSAIPIAVAVAKQIIPGEARRNLRILQIDERYGPVGHTNSNWQQLLDAGFELQGATYRPVLHGLTLPLTVEAYVEAVTDALHNCDLRIGLLGIGPDGHTAGMLPGSSAASEQHELVVSYQGPDFMRITMTTPALSNLDLALSFAGGEPKRSTLAALRQSAPIPTQPAQAIKKAADWAIYSDVLA